MEISTGLTTCTRVPGRNGSWKHYLSAQTINERIQQSQEPLAPESSTRYYETRKRRLHRRHQLRTRQGFPVLLLPFPIGGSDGYQYMKHKPEGLGHLDLQEGLGHLDLHLPSTHAMLDHRTTMQLLPLCQLEKA